MATFDVHKWVYSLEKKQFVKHSAVHTNVPEAFAYSERNKLKLQHPGKGIQFTVTENGSLLYTNEFPPKTKRRNACLNRKKSTLLTLQER